MIFHSSPVARIARARAAVNVEPHPDFCREMSFEARFHLRGASFIRNAGSRCGVSRIALPCRTAGEAGNRASADGADVLESERTLDTAGPGT